MNAKAKNKYLYDVLMANVSESSTSNTTQEAKPKNAVPTATPQEAFPPAEKVSKEEAYNDLPF